MFGHDRCPRWIDVEKRLEQFLVDLLEPMDVVSAALGISLRARPTVGWRAKVSRANVETTA